MSKSRIGDTTTEMEEQDLPIEGIADGSSSSMDESLSTLFASVLAPLHELHIHDEEEDESDEDDLNDLRWGESSVSDFSGKEKSSLFPPVVRRNHPSKQYQQLLANYHDSFNSTTTTISTSSIESIDRPPKIPKRRIITFSDEVEIREFEVKEASTITTSTDEEEEARLPGTIHDTQREKEDF